MYSIFLPFACLILDVITAYVYLKNDFWFSGLLTALLALMPLTVMASLVFCDCIKIKKATILIGFIHSGPQLVLQVILLFRYWDSFEGLLISYGTLDSPQYTMIVITCLCGALVMAKSSRECHFICQAPKKPLRVTASYFRASPFFLLHIAYRAVAIGLNCSMLPNWLVVVVLLVHYLANLIILHFLLKDSWTNKILSAFTSFLAPVVFPGSNVVTFELLKKLEAINSCVSSGIILATATLAQFLYEFPQCLSSPVISQEVETSDVIVEKELIVDICSEHWALKLGLLPWVAIVSLFYLFFTLMIVVLVSPDWLKLPAQTDAQQLIPDQLNIPEESYDSAYSSTELERVSLPSFHQYMDARQSDL